MSKTPIKLKVNIQAFCICLLIFANNSIANINSNDFQGNVINNGSTTFQYDDASNMRCTNCALSTKVNYDYDANHIRSKKLVGTTATYYFYGLNGSLLGEYTPASQLEKEYYYLGSKLLAERQKTGVLVPSITYYHNDVLGSPIAATDTTGTLKWREDYRPYGDRNFNDANAATETRWFAGKAQDADSRLSYFGARYYDPMLGRFMGMDSVGVSDTNIHSHNRYAYANNNPYRFVDPDGNSPIDIGFFAKDVGNLLVQETVYGAAVVNGNNGDASLAMEGMSAAVPDAAMSTIGLINPVPGTGGAMKGLAKAEKAVTSVENSASRSRTYTQSQRKAMFEKAEGKCEYCGTKLDPKKGSKNSFEADHKDSFKNGGETTMDNGAAACRSCNREKGGKNLWTEWKPPNER